MLSEDEIFHQINEINQTQDNLVRAWFSWQNDPTSIDDQTVLDVIRWRRVGLLNMCDWTQIPDSTADKEAWATYRQQLRDLPSSNANPRLIVFPTPPTL
jgi:hypothetical protein